MYAVLHCSPPSPKSLFASEEDRKLLPAQPGAPPRLPPYSTAPPLYEAIEKLILPQFFHVAALMLMTTSKPASLPFNSRNTRQKSGSLGRCILAHSSAHSAHQSTPIEIIPILSRPGVDEQGSLVEIPTAESHSADIRDRFHRPNQAWEIGAVRRCYIA